MKLSVEEGKFRGREQQNDQRLAVISFFGLCYRRSEMVETLFDGFLLPNQNIGVCQRKAVVPVETFQAFWGGGGGCSGGRVSNGGPADDLAGFNSPQEFCQSGFRHLFRGSQSLCGTVEVDLVVLDAIQGIWTGVLGAGML